MPAVLMFDLIISRPTASYLGMITGRNTPGLVIEMWLPSSLSWVKPAFSKTHFSRFQLTGVKRATRQGLLSRGFGTAGGD